MSPLIEKSERIDFVGLDLQGEEQYSEKDMFFYEDVKKAVLEFKQFLNDFGVKDKKVFDDCGLFERYNKIFGDFKK